MPGPESASAAVVPLLEDYLNQQAQVLHERAGDVTGVAITLAVEDRPLTIGSSSPVALAVDHTQYEIGTGPCLSALTTGIGLYVPDLGGDPRWGPYGPAAAALGAACCISVPVLVDDVPAAVVKIYAGRVDGLTPAQQDAARRTAQEVTGGIALARRLSLQAEELDDRVAAMDRRRHIDLALGVLMERTHVDAAAAFDLLRGYSQHTNTKIRDVAESLIASAAPGAAVDGANRVDELETASRVGAPQRLGDGHSPDGADPSPTGSGTGAADTRARRRGAAPTAGHQRAPFSPAEERRRG